MPETIRLRCCWPECAHEWDGTYTATDYTSCPRCHASFSFRKPIMLTPTPMPRDLSEEAVAEWLHDDYEKSARVVGWKTQEACRVPWKDLPAANQAVMLLTARAVLALVREKVREAADLACHSPYSNTRSIVDHVVSRVLGDHPQGGHGEGRPAREEAPRA